MADNQEELKTVLTSDTKGLEKGLKKVVSVVNDIENQIKDAFGGLDKGLSKSVSSISETDKKLQGMNKELKNVKIDVKGLDDFSKDILASTDDVEELINVMTDIELGFTGEDDLEELIDTFGEASKEVSLLEDALSLIDRVDINIEDDIYQIVNKAEDATDAIDDLYDELNNLDNFEISQMDFEVLVNEIQDAGIEVEDLGNTLKKLDKVTIDDTLLQNLADTAREAEGDVEGLDSALKSVGSSSNVKGVGSDFDDVGGSAKGAEGDVDNFDGALKGAGSGSSLPEVEEDLEGISEVAEDATGILETMAGVLSGIAGISGISEGIEGAMDSAESKYLMQFHLENSIDRDMTDKEMKNIISSYNKLSARHGEDEAREIIMTTSIRTDVKGGNDDKYLEEVIKNAEYASSIAFHYEGADADELIDRSIMVADSLDISTEEALGFHNAMLKGGFPPGELDTISEYAQTWKGLGMSSKQVMSTMMNITDFETWDVDSLQDGVKEFGIMLKETAGSVEDLTDEQFEMFEATDIGAQGWVDLGKAMRKGGDVGSKAWVTAVESIQKIEDPMLRHMMMSELVGTMYEDNGDKMINALFGVDGEQYNVIGGMEDMQSEMDNLDLTAFQRIQVALAEIAGISTESLEPLLEVVASVLETLASNPELVEGLTHLTTAVSLLLTALGGFATLEGIGKLFTFVKDGKIMEFLGGLTKAGGGKGLLATLAPLLGKLALVVAAIMVIAEILHVVKNLWGEYGEQIIMFVKAHLNQLLIRIGDFASEVQDKLNGIGAGIVEFGVNVNVKINETVSGVVSGFTGVIDGIQGFIENVSDKLISIVTWLLDTFGGVLEFLGVDVEGLKAKVTESFTGMSGSLTGTLEGWKTDAETKGKDFSDALTGKVTGATETAGGLFEKLGDNWGRISGGFTEQGVKGLTSLQGEIKAWESKMESASEGTFGSVTRVIDEEGTMMVDEMGNNLEDTRREVEESDSLFKIGGKGIMKQLAGGIREGKSFASEAMTGVLQSIRDLIPSSPPKDKSSPLADLHKNGIGQQLAKGILAGEGEVDNAMDKILNFGSSSLSMPDLEVDIERRMQELDTMVNGSIDSKVGVKEDLEVMMVSPDLHITQVIGGYELRGLVRRLTEEQEHVITMRQ